MTNESNDNDRRVSGAYREMANEQTPADLDRKVLAMAAAAARGRQGLPRTWFRPLAWAATIALSFALVLEISQVGDMPLVPDVTSPRTDADLADVLEESPRPAAATERQKNEALVNQQLNKRSSDTPAAGKAAITPSQAEAAAADAAVNTPAAESASVASDLEQDSRSLLREAEEQVRMRSEPDRALGALAATRELTDRCSQDARESAATWYECVRVLREAGQMEAAKLEFEALLVEFPDFEEPPADESGTMVR